MAAIKKWISTLVIFLVAALLSTPGIAQCSICTKTAQQLGEQPAKGLNAGIVYLAFVPLALVGIIGYRWWKNNRETV